MSKHGFVAGDRILGQSADSHTDWRACYGQVAAYRFIGASAIGKRHLHEDRPRDDAFAVRSAEEWLAVAVADGVGSCPQSRYGASFSVEALCEHLLREAASISASPKMEAVESASSIHARDQSINGKTGEPERPAENVYGRGDTAARSAAAKPLRNLLQRIFRYLPAFRRSAAKSDAGPSQTPPLISAFPQPIRVTPPDEAAAACGSLTWRRQRRAPNADRARSQPRRAGEEAAEPIDWDGRVRRAFTRARLDLEQYARVRGLLLHDLHCTLLGLLLNTQTSAVTVGHIGDGLVAALDGKGAGALVEAATPGKVGETYVLTQNDWEKYLAIRTLSAEASRDITTFYLMTDGVADDCAHPPPEDIFVRWARDIDRELRKEEPLPQVATRLLHWLAHYDKRGSWDDRTLVVVLRDGTS